MTPADPTSQPVPSHPVLSTEAVQALETRLFGGQESKEWEAMTAAGAAVAGAVLADLLEAGGLTPRGRILVLAGRGNNAGDALIAARVILEDHRAVTVRVVFVFGERKLRPLARRAWLALSEAGGARVEGSSDWPEGAANGPWDLCLDGVFGFNFRRPLPAQAAVVLAAANRSAIRLRAAVDLPSGLDEADGFRADFTYATGAVKAPLLGCRNAGRPRYLDLGFFEKAQPGEAAAGLTKSGLGGPGSDPGSSPGSGFSLGSGDRILLAACLAGLAGLRPSHADKRSQGHALIVAGSRSYPGAALMAVLAALRSGAGLVTGFVPESLVPSFAAQAPSAMWVGWPETPDGGLALEGRALLASRWARAASVLVGPGLGREGETLALAEEIARHCPAPLVVDADALQERVVHARPAGLSLILTPHAGEFARITGAGASAPAPGAACSGETLAAAATRLRAVIALKGPVTRVCAGGPVYHSLAGGPVLARGGSGDLLAGLVAGLLAQAPQDPTGAACRAVLWHGHAADLLARTRGQAGVLTPEVLDFLAPALRECAAWAPSRAN